MVSDDPESFADLDGHTNQASYGNSGAGEQTCAAAGAGASGTTASGCGNNASASQVQTQQQAQSPYQKYIEQQNRPMTEADKANALVQAGEMGAAGVKAGLAVVGVEAGVTGAVVAAPAVAATVSQVGTTITTAATSAYVQATTAASAAGAAVANAARAAYNGVVGAAYSAQTAALQLGVRLDTLKSGGGALKAAADFAQGLTPGNSTPRSVYGAAGRAIRAGYSLASKLF
jgi:hypothetical protein